jgi:hypothetical protein
MADDPLAAFGAAPREAPPAVLAQPTVAIPAPVSAADDPLAAFGAPAAETPQTTPAAALPPSQTDPAFFKLPNGQVVKIGMTHDEATDLNSGMDRGVRDVIDKPAEWLSRGTDAIGLTSGAGDTVAAENTANRAAYDQLPDASGLAGIGRIGTQIGATLPIGGVIGKLAQGTGDVIAAGAGRIAPILESGVNRVGAFLSGTGGGAGTIGSRADQAGSVITNSAIQGAGVGAITSGQSDAPVSKQALMGAVYGGVTGPILRTGAAGINAASKALSGGPINPEVQRLAQLGRDKYGLQLSGDMISPSPFVQNLGAALRQIPGSGMAPNQAGLQSQFTKAIAKTFGEDVEQITPAVMERAATRIGGVMDNVANQTPAIPASGLVDGLANVQHDASFLTPEQQGVIGKHINNVMDAISPEGTISGTQYQSLTKFNSPLGKALRSSDSDVRNSAIEIRGHLDDALSQSLPPDSPLAQQLKEARLQYKNLKTIEPLVTKGEPGEISPIGLQGQVNRSFKGRGMREAQPDLGELADIGRQFNLRPDSGTAGRTMVGAGMGAIGGAATSLMTGNPMNALYTVGGAAGTLGAGRLAGNMLRSNSYINSLLETPNNPNYAGASLMNKMIPYAAPTAAMIGGRLRRD